MSRASPILIFALVALAACGLAAWAENAPIEAAKKLQLSKLQNLVGAWRGVGQPERGSTKGSWTEAAAWAWDFSPGGPALIADQPQGKYFRRLKLSTTANADEYVVLATPAQPGEEIRYTGKLNADQHHVLLAESPPAGVPQRISLRFAANGDRLLMLLERQNPSTSAFSRLAEIGYTREGSLFGQGASQRECIVTGGLGAIQVTHEGKSYYVCCTGCRDYFNEDPGKVLAEYAARQAAAKKK
jgi:hypothetical protein